MGSVLPEIIPIDGKTLRGSYDREKGLKNLHLVTAWASEQRLVLGQVKVEDHSNEITALPALLELIDISGAIITIDAMGTQTEIVRLIRQKKADYVAALKSNALVRRLALNAVNQETTLQRSLRQKIKRAAMNNDYMMQILKCFCQA
jgi:predicted transposase YbfD/YdcC